MKTIEKMSLPELREMSERIAKALEIAKAREREDLRRELMAKAAQSGFSLAELFGAGKGRKPVAHSRPAKYRDPVTGTLWSGRGRMPRDFDRSRAEPLAQ